MGGQSTKEPPNKMIFQSKIEVVDIPGKGKGIIATEDIQECELILIEKPMMKVKFKIRKINKPVYYFTPGGTPGDPIPKALIKEADPFYRPKFKALSDAEKEQFMDLYDCYADEGDEKTVVGIFLTNSVAVVAGGFLRLFSYRLFSRFNHSCRPNVWRKVINGDEQHVYATRTVRKGEELYVSYIDHLATTLVRQKGLLPKYNFQCACEACAIFGFGRISESDQKREEISTMFALASCADHQLQAGELDRLHKVYQMCEVEHVFTPSLKGILAFKILEASFLLPEADKPRAEVAKYAEDCYRSFRCEYGDQHEKTKMAKEYVRMCETDAQGSGDDLKI